MCVKVCVRVCMCTAIMCGSFSKALFRFERKMFCLLESAWSHSAVAGQTVKQADVVLLGYPLEFSGPTFNTTTRYNDLMYYGNRTDPDGPAMTWAMYCIGLLELGYNDEAAAYFSRAYQTQQPPFMVWTETVTGGTPNFITGYESRVYHV